MRKFISVFAVTLVGVILGANLFPPLLVSGRVNST
jgi:hypothetical protein